MLSVCSIYDHSLTEENTPRGERVGMSEKAEA